VYAHPPLSIFRPGCVPPLFRTCEPKAVARLSLLADPGTSTKVFHALFCTEFDGEGEDNSRVLAADYSIDCDSMSRSRREREPAAQFQYCCLLQPSVRVPLCVVYAGFLWPYAVIMLFIYPIGVPLFYYLTLYRDKQELHEIRCLELFIANEKQRAKLGEFLRGKARREYQPEIEEAIEREGELTKEYAPPRLRFCPPSAGG
jgi:hypothetical protein